jgi:hypothetical protein
MKCHIIDFDAVNWSVLDGFSDRTVFQTREWVQFIRDTQKASPLIAELREGTEIAGYFTGLTFRRFGIKILGSSFPGWTTPYIGFNLVPGASRASALAAVQEMAWGSLKCLHMEISDPGFTSEEGKSLGFTCGAYASYRTDLRRPEHVLFDGMTAACRRCIRKAETSGVKIEEAHDAGFAGEYYGQLVEVFARQKLVPTYNVERVRALIAHLEPVGRVLLLRARDADGRCIATGVFPGFNKIAEFWGNASIRSSQILRPNELMHWYAMRYWKRRGVEIYDWGGEGKYKEKYGCVPYRVPWFTKSRHDLLSKLRDEAKKVFQRKQKFLGWLHGE